MTTDTPSTSAATGTAASDARESMIFYASYLRSVKQLPGRQRHLLIEAILDYCISGIDPSESLTGAAAAVFIALQPALDLQRERTADTHPKARKSTGRPAAPASRAGAPKGNRNNPYGRAGKRAAEKAADTPVPEQPQEAQPAAGPQPAKPAATAAEDREVCPGMSFREFWHEFTSSQDIPSVMGITQERFHSLTREIMAEWGATSTTHSDYASTARHFYYHLRRKIELSAPKNRPMTTAQANLAEGKRRWEERREQERLEREEAYRRPRASREKIAAVMADLGIRPVADAV